MGRGGFTCLSSSSSSRTAEVDWRQKQRQRLRQRSVDNMPFWNHQQNLNYGKYAYQDVSSSDDSDMEFGPSRNQMVSLANSFSVGILNV